MEPVGLGWTSWAAAIVQSLGHLVKYSNTCSPVVQSVVNKFDSVLRWSLESPYGKKETVAISLAQDHFPFIMSRLFLTLFNHDALNYGVIIKRVLIRNLLITEDLIFV